MSKMVKEHATSDQKAYTIRNLNKIENPSEFFELINKTGSDVTCTADGIVVNNAIDIASEAYNEIGKVVFQDRLTQITRYQKSALHESLRQEFGQYIPSERKEDFETRLKDIESYSSNERRTEMRNLVEEFNGNASVTGEAFDTSWNKVEGALQSNIDKQITKMINNLQQGSTGVEQKKDFDDLKKLATKKINSGITAEEKQQLEQLADKCSQHRKQHFFQSSADHRNDADTLENRTAFKNDIKTFTNGQNERLCYRIDVNEVKSKLQTIFQQPNIEDVTINGQRIFSNMKIGDYDRLNRVFKTYGSNAENLMRAAKNIANDPNFAGQVNTPHDMVSITEAINTNMV